MTLNSLLPDIREQILAGTAESPSTSRLTLSRRRLARSRTYRRSATPAAKVFVRGNFWSRFRGAAKMAAKRRGLRIRSSRRTTPSREVSRHWDRWVLRRSSRFGLWSRCGGGRFRSGPCITRAPGIVVVRKVGEGIAVSCMSGCRWFWNILGRSSRCR